ncbi:DUF6090 family protein [Hwangdonia lutea]|uniref:DUF6090 family protein n=1 Tax=Hwangdonia lutea TaxID=3075823 RepID=A0AA97EMP8_9FLAO|nr:DUF6090 family protein [Hwangdonia sp. SCSIO 19198]WOD44219.1 DUF6090 family protein [Hwangdonia sp. SCSIO 19198]
MKKQFKYAIGEILIVIVGISIAFSINKYAEIQKNNALKKQYLENIKSDIEIDKQHLQNNYDAIETKITTLNEVIPLLNTDTSVSGKSIFKIFKVFSLTEFYPKDITYQTMINSGDFKLIDDFGLKTAIEEHYSNYKSILKDYERQEIIHKDYLGKYMIYDMDFDAMRKGASGLKDEKLFKNILQSMSGSLLIKKSATERGIKSCDSLLNILNKV